MPIPPSALAVAQQEQTQAAHSGSPQVRLIAGPGTGKSSAIEERLRWLIEQGVEPGRFSQFRLPAPQRLISLCHRIRVADGSGFVPLAKHQHVLVHELVHVCQFEAGGPDYVAEALR
jgi:hypothetical protein